MSTNHHAIALVTINRLRRSYNRKAGTFTTRRTAYTGVMYTENPNFPGMFDLLLAGPRGGVKIVTVWTDGRYSWRSFSAPRNSGEQCGRVTDWDFEIAHCEPKAFGPGEVDQVLNG